MPRRGENIRKRTDGRWEGRYKQDYDKNGKAKYKSIYGKSYREVKDKLKNIMPYEKVESVLLEGDIKNLKYKEVLYQWLSCMQMHIKTQTYARYLNLIHNHIVPILGEEVIYSLNTERISQYILMKGKNGRLDGKGGLSSSTLQSILYIMRASLGAPYHEAYRIPTMREVIMPMNRKPPVRALTLNEQEKLEKTMKIEMDGSQLGIILCLYTGLRIGEICCLRWSSIDWEEELIRITESVQRIKNFNESENQKTVLKVGFPKSKNSIRNIPIPRFLYTILLKESKKHQGNSYILSGSPDTMIEPRTYEYRFKSYLKRSGVPLVNFHILRHTFATRCIEQGFEIKCLSEILGHSNINITLNTYVHSSMNLKRKQMELLGNIRGQ